MLNVSTVEVRGWKGSHESYAIYMREITILMLKSGFNGFIIFF